MNPQSGPFLEIASIIARYATDETYTGTAIGSLFFSRRSSPSQCLHVAQSPCFALVVQGQKSITLGHETYRYGVGDFLLVSLELPVVSQVTQASEDEPHMGLGMSIDSNALADLMSRISIPHRALAATDRLGVAVNIASPGLLDATLRLLRLLDRLEDIPALAPLAEQEILYHLLTGPCGAQLIQIAVADSPGNRIARSIAWLRDHFREPLRVDELAERVGMSVSSLHHHFKAVTAMTPMQYQKQLRMHEARRLMLLEKLDVGTAGYRVGYQSTSQFSREYGRLYGLPPLRDIERIRGLDTH
ncbi:AraC family transcriptional regulator [Luteibacter rhizovicinus]|uniref:AraC family transcriptional regulator n=1 Tax=Luteibacter rhizovicinus TaxID=242606 RepID=A0A4R3YP96_9GAMM|nr:AraC family transcriptional regulator [Luteibacter rhizovicinus]TCV92733.1 AraC family transcriptional regulator [Luteibacter rhizovicinus]